MNIKIRNIIIFSILTLVLVTQSHKNTASAEIESVKVDNRNIETKVNESLPGVSEKSSTLVYIPDKNLKIRLKDVLNISNREITSADMKKLEILYISEWWEVKDITGLEHATNLKSLYINQIPISNIKPLSKLVNLTNLSIDFANIKDISSLSKLVNLEYLSLCNNRIEDISSLKNLRNLKSIWLQENLLNDDDLKNIAELTNLEELMLHNNKIENISNLSKLTKLRRLDLSENNISDISKFPKLDVMYDLNLSGNKLKDVTPLSNIKEIDNLSLSRNQISNLKPLENIKIGYLYADNNKISDLSQLMSFKSLYAFNVAYNNISVIPKEFKDSDIGTIWYAEDGRMIEAFEEQTIINSAILNKKEVSIKNPISIFGTTMKPTYISDGGKVVGNSIQWSNIKSSRTVYFKYEGYISKTDGDIINVSITVKQPIIVPKSVLTKDIYKYDAGKGKYLTYINGKGYSQYSYLNTSGKYAFTPSSWMTAAGLTVTMPTSSNGYTMKIDNPYKTKSIEAQKLLDDINKGNLTRSSIIYKLNQINKIEAKSISTDIQSRASVNKILTKDIYKYDAGSGKYLTYINGKGYSQYVYLNTSGKYAFTPSSWMTAAGLTVTMPTSSNGYTMKITNPYKTKYNNLVKQIEEQI